MAEPHLPVFVYGTLQRGQERGNRWPFPPVKVEWATVRGRIHDLGPYPALVDGSDLVLGELWHLRPEHLDETLRALDAIECFGVDEVDLYVRRVVDCQTLSGQSYRAHVYFLADPSSSAAAPAVPPDARGYCRWTKGQRG
jgi:gamma-glutamylcyclotransferase (GGCT)/AIG2-like uncharacterized protein YtfP